MDLLDRRIARRLTRQLALPDGEQVLDFDIGVSRPHASLPAPLPAQPSEQARIEVAVSTAALYLRMTSRSARDGTVARIPWSRVRTFGPHRAEGRWRRWSLRGGLTDGTEVVVSLTGKPRPSLLRTLADLGVDPGDPGERGEV